jgi:hypothetical protein
MASAQTPELLSAQRPDIAAILPQYWRFRPIRSPRRSALAIRA